MTTDVPASWAKHASDAAKRSNQEFQSWFDAASSEQEAVANGMLDFFHRIYTPAMHDVIGDPRGRSCLEIGSGGGRLLNAAASVFGHAYGVDVLLPDGFDRAREFLRSQGRENVTLCHRDQMIETVPRASIAFAYSFIAIQHFPGQDELIRYLGALAMLLDFDGAAMLFYARCNDGKQVQVSLNEFAVNPKASTLFMSEEHMRGLVKAVGLKVVDAGPAGRKKLWLQEGESRQNFVLVTR